MIPHGYQKKCLEYEVFHNLTTVYFSNFISSYSLLPLYLQRIRFF